MFSPIISVVTLLLAAYLINRDNVLHYREQEEEEA